VPNGGLDIHAAAATVAASGIVTFTGFGTSVSTSLNLIVDGFLSANQMGDMASLNLFILVRDPNQIQNYLVDQASTTIYGPVPNGGGIAGTGNLPPAASNTSHVLNHHTYQSATFTLPLNVPVELYIALHSQAIARACPILPACTAEANFANTVYLPLSGPVFNLPSGVTVESADWAISNNQFSPVPEPSTGVLAASLLAAVAAGQWRRSRRANAPAAH